MPVRQALYFLICERCKYKFQHQKKRRRLTVGLLEPGAGSWTAELLGLASPGVGYQQATVVLNKGILDCLLALLVNILLIVSDESLGQSLSDGVDLSDSTASLDTDPHVNISEPVLTQELDRLGELVLEGLRLNLCEGLAIDTDKSLSAFAVGHGSGGLLATKGLN